MTSPALDLNLAYLAPVERDLFDALYAARGGGAGWIERGALIAAVWQPPTSPNILAATLFRLRRKLARERSAFVVETAPGGEAYRLRLVEFARLEAPTA